MKHTCPVCGWTHLEHAPRSVSGGASHEICPSCGFEFGFDDDDQGLTYEDGRRRWAEAGMKWWSTSRPAPHGWNAAEQLRRAGL